MSEYQYYEFRAIDRPLTRQEMAELRALSGRALITPMSFVNTYNWGDFKGNPSVLMENYFDAFVYVANWGTHELMLRLPGNSAARDEVLSFCRCEGLHAWVKRPAMVLRFRVNELPGDWEEGEGWMDSLTPIREDLIRGDYRALYLGWLLGVQNNELDDEEPEPPPPPGLCRLTEPLESLVNFLKIDTHLIAAAARTSRELDDAPPSRAELRRWVKSLPAKEKDSIVLDLISAQSPSPLPELLRRFERSRRKPSSSTTSAHRPRTAGQLRAAAEELVREEQRHEQERRAREEEGRRREEAAARAKFLEDLERQGEAPWATIDDLIAMKRPEEYDRAVELLGGLGELAERAGQVGEFRSRVERLRKTHSRKSSFLRRLKAAGIN